MGQVFALAKEFMSMELDEVGKMLESPIHEMRVGAVSIMDFQACDPPGMYGGWSCSRYPAHGWAANCRQDS